MAFTYTLEVEVSPRQVRLGQVIEATAVVRGESEPVGNVQMRLSGTGYAMKMKEVGPNRFAYKVRVPAIVPSGSYTIEFFAVSRRGSKGTVIPVNITVTR